MARKVDVDIGVKNKTSAGLKAVGAGIKRFSRNITSSMRSMGRSFRRVALVGVASFTALIKAGNSFRASMAEVKTMLGDDKSALPELTRQVRELSASFGLAKKTLAEGLYQALSAGVPAKNAIEFLTVASKAAVGGVTDVKTAVDGLTSVINAYGIEASKVTQVSDILFTVVKEGKINFEELSQNIGNIAPFAKVARVGIEDLSAMIATLVKVDKPERAMTSLRQAMVFAAKVGKPLLQVLEEFEGKSLEDLLKAGVTQKSAAGIAIMSSNMEVLRKEMALFKNTAGAANDAFEDVSAVRGWQRLWQSVLAITSEVGERLDSKLQPALVKVKAAISSTFDDEAISRFVKKVTDVTKATVKFATAIRDNKVKIYVGLITAAVVALSVKVLILASRFKLLTMSMKSNTIAAYANYVAVQLTGKAAGWAASKVLLLKLSMIALKGVLVGAVAAGFMAITKAALDSNEAVRKLLATRKALAATEARGKKEIGAGKGKTLKLIRETVQSGNKDDIENLRKRHPKAVKFMEDSIAASQTKTPSNAPSSLIGLGKGVPNAGGAGLSGVSASTSLLSASDLFTMIQTGGAAKKETELAELQGVNARLDKIIDLSGGVK